MKSRNQLRSSFLLKRKSGNNAGSEKGENSNCERRGWVEYGLNKTGGKKAAKVCELIWFLHLVLYFIEFPWHQLMSDCLLLSVLYIVCTCAGAFLKTAGRTVHPGLLWPQWIFTASSCPWQDYGGLVGMQAAPSPVLGANSSLARQEFRR